MSTTASKPSPPPVVQRALLRAIAYCERQAAALPGLGPAWLREADEYRCFLAKIEPPKKETRAS